MADLKKQNDTQTSLVPSSNTTKALKEKKTYSRRNFLWGATLGGAAATMAGCGVQEKGGVKGGFGVKAQAISTSFPLDWIDATTIPGTTTGNYQSGEKYFYDWVTHINNNPSDYTDKVIYFPSSSNGVQHIYEIRHTETLKLPPGCRLIGDGAATRLQTWASGSSPNAMSTHQANLIELHHQNIRLENFTIRTPNATTYATIQITSDFACLSGLSVEGTQTAIQIASGQNITIKENRLTSNSYGIVIGASQVLPSDILIEGNMINKDSTAFPGVTGSMVGITFTGDCERVSLSNNLITKLDWGIYISGINCDSLLISNNNIFKCEEVAIYAYGSTHTCKLLISNNMFQESKKEAIKIDGMKGPHTIIGNSIHGSTLVGFWSNVPYNVVVNNLISSNLGGGILLASAQAEKSVCANNILTDNNAIGIECKGSNNLFIGNSIHNIQGTTTTTGISLQSSASNIKIIGNHTSVTTALSSSIGQHEAIGNLGIDNTSMQLSIFDLSNPGTSLPNASDYTQGTIVYIKPATGPAILCFADTGTWRKVHDPALTYP